MDKNDVINKWKPLLDNMGVSDDKKDWLSQYAQYHQENERNVIGDFDISTSPTATTSTDWSNVTLLPFAMRVAARTIAGGGYFESDERIKRRKRIKKLERILDEEQFKDVVSKEEYDDIMVEKKDVYQDGLIAVKPMSGPVGTLMFMDFKYGETEAEKAEKKRKERENKFDRIFKKLKQDKCRRKNSKKK